MPLDAMRLNTGPAVFWPLQLHRQRIIQLTRLQPTSFVPPLDREFRNIARDDAIKKMLVLLNVNGNLIKGWLSPLSVLRAPWHAAVSGLSKLELARDLISFANFATLPCRRWSRAW